MVGEAALGFVGGRGEGGGGEVWGWEEEGEGGGLKGGKR